MRLIAAVSAAIQWSFHRSAAGVTCVIPAAPLPAPLHSPLPAVARAGTSPLPAPAPRRHLAGTGAAPGGTWADTSPRLDTTRSVATLTPRGMETLI